MSFSSRSIKTAISAALILTMSVVAFADTIRLKDGSILKGRIVSFAGGKFTIAIGEGSRMKQMTYSASEIDSIQFDAPDKMPMTTPSSSNSTRSKRSAPFHCKDLSVYCFKLDSIERTRRRAI